MLNKRKLKRFSQKIKQKEKSENQIIKLPSECRPRRQCYRQTKRFFTLFDLNSNCLKSILKLLPLTDLFLLSQTCKRLHQLAGEHFQRQYPEIRMEIGSYSNIKGQVKY